MEEKRIIELLTRKMAGEAYPHELEELNRLVSQYPDILHLEEVLKQIWNAKTEQEDVLQFYKRHQKRYVNEFGEFNKPEDFPVINNTHTPKKKRTIILAGVLVAIISAGFILFSSGSLKIHSSNFTEIIAGKGVRKKVVLPDGTKVWINSESQISFDPKMVSQGVRKVDLDGEAFFDVAHDASHPFIINTNKVSIKVLGTMFNIMAYPFDTRTETTLLRGSIELSVNDDLKEKFLLKSSEKLTVNYNKEKFEDKGDNYRHSVTTLTIDKIEPVKLASKEYFPETAWMDNKLIFENQSFIDLLPKLQRWFNVKITIANKEVEKFKFTGAFTNETIVQALDAMKMIKSFKYEIHDKNITIY